MRIRLNPPLAINSFFLKLRAMENHGDDFGFIDQESLSEIRKSTDWKALFIGLGLRKAEKRSKEDDWWAWSPFKDEKTPSFHMVEGGRWYDFSIREGGGVIELVQRLYNLDCYEAGHKLLERGWATLPEAPKEEAPHTVETKSLEPNTPIRQTLIPLLSQQGTHETFISRGISKETCEELGCGFLDNGRSPLNGRIVFQVRGIEEKHGKLEPVILSHIGMSTTQEQAESQGEWLAYKNFDKSLELLNIDKLLLDERAKQQVQSSDHILLVKDPFDVAKCWEADIFNVTATFGSDISDGQIEKIHLIQRHLKPKRFVTWFGRDRADISAQTHTLRKLAENGFSADSFDWEQKFSNKKTVQPVSIPENIKNPCDMSVRQLQWLHGRGVI